MPESGHKLKSPLKAANKVLEFNIPAISVVVIAKNAMPVH
jgi:hypothetical protein